ncbi:MAG: sugar ABC transporter permease [Caldilinea sp. CFX5]|nr:sugar ABC transporter permease [Caldilinea sp. CFX5]
MIRRSGRSRRWWRILIAGYLFVLPWILGFLIFTAGPMIASIVISFMKWEVITTPEYVGVQNFTDLVQDPLFATSLYNTAFYTILAVPLQLIVALLTAMLLNNKVRGIALYRTIYYLPSVTPVVASAMLWLWIFNPEFGLANALLDKLGLPKQLWLLDPNWAKPAFIFMSLWGVGGTMVIFLAGLQGVPAELYEAASIDGANSGQRFWQITLPMLTPVIFFNLLIGLIDSFQIFSSAYIMTDGGPQNRTLFYVLYLYRNGFKYFQMGYASALAWVLFVIVLLFTLLQFRLSKRWVYYETDVGL